MDEENEDFWQTSPDGRDDGNGEFDETEGCSYCGYWQCSGCSG